MDVFNALWDQSDQKKRPPDEDFQLFTMEEWFCLSSTHKILSGSLRCPLPPELEHPEQSSNTGFSRKSADAVTAHGATSSSGPPHCSSGRSAEIQSKIYIPGLVKQPEIDRVSVLTSDEHQDCMRLFLKFDGKALEDISPSDMAEYQLFQSLLVRVKEEQKDFLEYAKQDWLEYVDRTCKLRADPFNFFLQHWMDRVSRIMAQYYKHYQKLRPVSLSREPKIPMRLQFAKNALNIGKIPVIKLPTFDRPFRIATKSPRLRPWSYLNIPSQLFDGTLHKVPVSRDPNAEKLARLNEASFILSSGSFKCLLDNYDSKVHPSLSGIEKSWILPVIVKEHRTFSNGKPVLKTSVFIDKPLPQSRLSSYEKVTWYHKHALFAAAVHRHHEGAIRFHIAGKNIMTRKSEDIPEAAKPDDFKNSGTINIEQSRADFQIENESRTDILKKEETAAEFENLREARSNLQNEKLTRNFLKCDEIRRPGVKSVKETRSELENNEKTGTESQNEKGIRSDIQNVNETNIDFLPKVTIQDSINGHGLESDDCVSDDEVHLTIDIPGDQASSPRSASVDETLKMQELELGKDKSIIVVQNESFDTADLKATVTMGVLEKEVENSDQVPLISCTPPKLSTKWDHLPPPAEVKTVDGNALPTSDTNVVYNLWSLQPEKKETHTDQSIQMDCFNILVRSRIDGCELLGSGKTEALSLACKPEFQLEYGAGVVSLSDLTRQWAKLSIQPNTRVARVRVSVAKAEMVKLDKLSKLELEQEAQHLYQVDLNDTLLTLYNVLSNLRNLPCGEYLLSHSPEMGLGAELFVKSNQKDAADLSLTSAYGNLPKEIGCDVPWQPLDPSVMLPRNIFFKSMPCTFRASWAPKTVRKPTKPAPLAETKKRKKKKGSKK